MATDTQDIAERWAERGTYFLLMGLGAVFVYFNELYGWVQAPDYPRLTDFVFDPLAPYVDRYLPWTVVMLGALFLLAAGYSFYRFVQADAAGGSTA